MLLFHGTTLPALDDILKHGLRPPQPHATAHDWVAEISGRSQGSAVFVSTAPVAGKGGDPVSFAMGWPVKRLYERLPGYIVVVDLPPDALALVHAVVPNVELNTFISVYLTRSFLRETVRIEAVGQPGDDQTLARWTLSHWCVHYWLARYCADHHIALTPPSLASRVALQLKGADPALPSNLTPLRWRAFLDDYFRLIDFAWKDIDTEEERERRRHAVLRRYGITLPDDVESDVHRKTCRLCVGGLVGFVHRFDGFADYEPFLAFLRAQPMHSSYHRLPAQAHIGPYVVRAPIDHVGLEDLQSLAMRLRAVAAHTAPFAEDAVVSFFWTHESSSRSPRKAPWMWDQWYAAFPVEQCTLSHAWQPGYCRHFGAADLKRPDCQIIADAIPVRYILGAIKISDGARILPHLRPSRRKGETLASKLWTLAHAMRAQHAGTPVLLD
jgi:hypothetical protein